MQPTLKLSADDAATFRAELVRLRNAQRMTQKRLAKAVKISYPQMKHIEYGENLPSLPVYLRLCRTLGIKAVPLFSREGVT